ncbi:hypothetical protein [Georgenia sp. SUBG003]|uniref:hypothetical protein n=1 Tax=Georgenia sp. SUBG003 TaxID=1497974 RepID=UPI003AB66F76
MAGELREAAECAGRSIPASKISIQMFSYAGWAREIGTEAVLAELAEIGYKNVEPFGGTYEGRSAEDFSALLKEYGLKSPPPTAARTRRPSATRSRSPRRSARSTWARAGSPCPGSPGTGAPRTTRCSTSPSR